MGIQLQTKFLRVHFALEVIVVYRLRRVLKESTRNLRARVALRLEAIDSVALRLEASDSVALCIQAIDSVALRPEASDSVALLLLLLGLTLFFLFGWLALSS